jgi:hypothetical protein
LCVPSFGGQSVVDLVIRRSNEKIPVLKVSQSHFNMVASHDCFGVSSMPSVPSVSFATREIAFAASPCHCSRASICGWQTHTQAHQTRDFPSDFSHPFAFPQLGVPNGCSVLTQAEWNGFRGVFHATDCTFFLVPAMKK